jgi:hypothetical protein
MNENNQNRLIANLFVWRITQAKKLNHVYDVNKQLIERPRLRTI